MGYRIFVILSISLLILTACGNESEPTTGTAPTPTLTNAQRIALSQTLAALQSATDTPIPPTDTPVTSDFDPGPFFTPRRNAPGIPPDEFIPDAQIGDFTRTNLQRTCLSQEGQLSFYSNADNAQIQLSCHYKRSARDARAMISTLANSPALNGEPLFYEIQGGESFVLGASGEGFIYAWTHTNWVFIARSPTGRDPLNQFMEAFPY